MPGFSEACVTGHHEACVDPDCRCLHHPKVQAMMGPKPPIVVMPGSANLICPACAKPGKSGDRFCRQDGVQLTEGKVCACGAGAEPNDVYCGACGAKFGAGALPVPDLSEDELLALEKKVRLRPSDVEVPPVEMQ